MYFHGKIAKIVCQNNISCSNSRNLTAAKLKCFSILAYIYNICWISYIKTEIKIESAHYCGCVVRFAADGALCHAEQRHQYLPDVLRGLRAAEQ